MISHIIWDYNGTVVDDVVTSIAAVNKMLESRGLPPTSIEIYRETLTIPLDKYYASVGIKNADIKKLSVEFQNWCNHFSYLSSIFDGFHNAIKIAKSKSVKNILLSSLYNEFLMNEVEKYKIKNCFDDIIGMQDTAVGSKLNNAKNYLSANNIDAKNVLFVGDLTTDSDMAKALGAKCVLIPNGHNSTKRCASQGVDVVENLIEFSEYIKRI